MKERRYGGVKGAEERREMRGQRGLVTGEGGGTLEWKGRAAEIGDKNQKLQVDRGGGRKCHIEKEGRG